jgi:hypothetical protein
MIDKGGQAGTGQGPEPKAASSNHNLPSAA